MPSETVLILLAWACELSGYPMPATVPVIVVEPLSYFRSGVVGTVTDGVIHIAAATPESFLVHEIVHTLQPADMPLCEREREAYAVQNAYLLATGQLGFFRAPACREVQE